MADKCTWCGKETIQVKDDACAYCPGCTFTKEECDYAKVYVTFCPQCGIDVPVCVKTNTPKETDDGSNRDNS